MASGILRPAPGAVGGAVNDSVAALANFATGRAIRGCRAAVAPSASLSALAVLVGKILGPPAGRTAWQLDVLKTFSAQLFHQAIRGRRCVRAARGQPIWLGSQLTCQLAACLPPTSTDCCRNDQGIGEFWQLLLASTNNIGQDVAGISRWWTHWFWGPCCGRCIRAGTGRKLPIEPRDGSTAFTTAVSSTTRTSIRSETVQFNAAHTAPMKCKLAQPGFASTKLKLGGIPHRWQTLLAINTYIASCI